MAEALRAAGHEVTGLAQSENRAKRLEQNGIRPWLGDLHSYDRVAEGAAACDAAIQCALGRDPNAPLVDRAAEAMLDSYAGTGKAFLHTSDVWVMGNTRKDADETAPPAAPPVVAWRMGIEKTVLDAAARQIRTVVIRPGTVYGGGSGFVATLE